MWTALYRWYDVDGVLLYVGISCWPENRAADHRRYAEWHGYAVSCAFQWFARRALAEDAEREAYTHEVPVFNRNGVPPAEQRRRRDWYAEVLATR